jgi:F420H(2)-dependent biliverdin reductase
MTAFRPGWDAFPPALWEFYTTYRLSTLTTLRPDGRPHTVPVGVMLDAENECGWIITRATSRKVTNILDAERRGETAHVTVCQVERGQWSTIEGRASVVLDPVGIERATTLYAERYRPPSSNREGRAAIRIDIDRILCSRGLVG